MLQKINSSYMWEHCFCLSFLFCVVSGAGLLEYEICTNTSYYSFPSPNDTDINLIKYGTAGAFNSTNYPISPENWLGKVGSHVPQVKVFLAPFVRITVPHEMVEDHWITAVWATDQNNDQIMCSEFNYSTPLTVKDDAVLRAGIEFYVPSRVNVVKAFEDCNAHGVWQADDVQIPSDMCTKQQELIQENELLHDVNSAYFFKDDEDKNYPVTWAGKVGSHVPKMTIFLSWSIQVEVHHEMINTHWITAIWLKDHNGNDLPANTKPSCMEYGENGTAIMMYELPKNFNPQLQITAYEHCNKHGVWQSNNKPVPSNFCDNEKYKSFVAENEILHQTAGYFTDQYYPDGWQAKAQSHVPLIEQVDENTWKATVKHEDTNSHWIGTIWVVDQSGNEIACGDFLTNGKLDTTTVPGETSINFTLPNHVTSLTAYEHCNLHGAWKSEELLLCQISVNKQELLQENTDRTPWTMQNPMSSDLQMAHIPFFPPGPEDGEQLFLAPKARIIVFHPPEEETHYITKIWAEDQNGNIISCKTFDGNELCNVDDKENCLPFKILYTKYVPYFDFYVPRSATTITAWAHCNLHAVWRGPSLTIDYNYCKNGTIERLLEENMLLHNTSGAFNASNVPSGWSKKVASHVPQMKMFLAPMVRVTVAHEMKPMHWITTIWLTDQNGQRHDCEEFDLNKTATVDFYLPFKTTSVKAWEHCNMHGVWESEVLQLPSGKDYCADTDLLIQENYVLYNTNGPFWKDYFPAPPQFPISWAVKAKSHVPQIKLVNAKHRVTVPHEMTNTHWITAIWIVDQDNNTLHCEDFSPNMPTGPTKEAGGIKGLDEEGYPYIEFSPGASVTHIFAYEHCNAHGVWQTCFNEAQMILRNADFWKEKGIPSDEKYGEAVPFSRSITPKNWVDMRASHIPDITMIYAPMARIVIDHVMEPGHKITAIWAYDQDGSKLICESLNRTAYPLNGPITFDYYLPIGTTSLTVYENCDIHGVWQSESISAPNHMVCAAQASWKNADSVSPALLVDANLDLYKVRGAFTTTSFPDKWSGRVNSHVPMMTSYIDGAGATIVRVEVRHEMKSLHWITAIWVEDKSGNVIFCKDFNAIQQGWPNIEFPLPPDVLYTDLTAFEHCNQHGVWSSVAQGEEPTEKPSTPSYAVVKMGILFPFLSVIFGIIDFLL